MGFHTQWHYFLQPLQQPLGIRRWARAFEHRLCLCFRFGSFYSLTICSQQVFRRKTSDVFWLKTHSGLVNRFTFKLKIQCALHMFPKFLLIDHRFKGMRIGNNHADHSILCLLRRGPGSSPPKPWTGRAPGAGGHRHVRPFPHPARPGLLSACGKRPGTDAAALTEIITIFFIVSSCLFKVKIRF